MQKTGEATRDRWHKTDWKKVAEEPESIAFRREDWIHEHDAEGHANEVFDDIFKRFSDSKTESASALPSNPAPVAV